MNFSKMNLFGSKDSLPMHGGSRKSNGVSGISVVNKKVALSVLWVLISLIVVVFGFWHCRSKGYHYIIECDKEDCKIISKSVTTTYIKFPKSDLLDVESVRIDKQGEFSDPAKIKRERKAKFGYSIRLKVRQPVDEGSRLKTEKWIMYNPNDMGRRLSKSGTQKVRSYMENKTQSLYLNNGKTVTMVGVLSIFLGLVSLLFAVVFGEWQDSNPRRMKKSS